MPYYGQSSSKKETIKHKEFVTRYAEKMGCSEEEAVKYLKGFLYAFYEGIAERRPITIEHFGNFHLSEHSESIAFRFNPSQKLKAALGWPSTYSGEM